MTDEKNANAWSQIFTSKVVVPTLIAIVTAVGGYLFSAFPEAVIRDPNSYKFILSLLNLLVVVLFFAFSQATPELEFREDTKAPPGKKKNDAKLAYWDKLNVEVKAGEVEVEGKKVDQIKQAGYNEKRVNKLVKQLHENINYFAFFLIVVYVLFLFDNQLLLNYLQISEDRYNYYHSFFKAAEDIFNFLSAVFIFTAFKVLYDRTLDGKNNDNGYRRRPILFAAFFVAGYLFFAGIIYPPLLYYKTASINRVNELLQHNEPSNAIKEINLMTFRYDSGDDGMSRLQEIKEIASSNDKAPDVKVGAIKSLIEVHRNKVRFFEILANLIQLFIGTFNGLTMALLFGRYISMEHVAQIISHIKHKRHFSWATIYILPIYALTQPLFGSFEIDAFGDPKWFQNYVFFFCFIGKSFFLYFTWRFMKDRLMHYYLHIMLAKYGIPKDFDTCFDFVHPNQLAESANRASLL